MFVCLELIRCDSWQISAPLQTEIPLIWGASVGLYAALSLGLSVLQTLHKHLFSLMLMCILFFCWKSCAPLETKLCELFAAGESSVVVCAISFYRVLCSYWVHSFYLSFMFCFYQSLGHFLACRLCAAAVLCLLFCPRDCNTKCISVKK